MLPDFDKWMDSKSWGEGERLDFLSFCHHKSIDIRNYVLENRERVYKKWQNSGYKGRWFDIRHSKQRREVGPGKFYGRKFRGDSPYPIGGHKWRWEESLLDESLEWDEDDDDGDLVAWQGETYAVIRATSFLNRRFGKSLEQLNAELEKSGKTFRWQKDSPKYILYISAPSRDEHDPIALQEFDTLEQAKVYAEKIMNPFIRRARREDFPTQQQIMEFLSKYFPKETPEQRLFNDRYGLQNADPSAVVKRILICTTPSSGVVRDFTAGGYDLLISHHDMPAGVPQIIMHSTMDFGDKGHNAYFAQRIGLRDFHRVGGYFAAGTLYKPMHIIEFKHFLQMRGFPIEGMIWRNPESKDQWIQSVLFCSGMGGCFFKGQYCANKEMDLHNIDADVFVTGHLLAHPKETPNKFKFIIELGHTPSEKPVFTKVKIWLKNRWQNLEIDFAKADVDRFEFGDNLYNLNPNVSIRDLDKTNDVSWVYKHDSR